jgi:hypothetical protein
MARLEGWTFLLQGRDEEARVKLSAVAERDPLAQLGMIRLMEKEGANADRVTQEARKLMTDAPSGVVGAIVHDALRDKKPRLAPGELAPLTPEAEAVKAELDSFPREWLDVLDKDKTSRYYVLRIEPLKVTHEYGDPILARVTVQNISSYDITVGPEGTIRPDVWFQVQVRGLIQGGFDGIAFDRLGGKVLLKPQEKIVQNVRIDQAGLTQMMQQNAAVAMPIYISAFNNPIALPQGIPVPGPGGQRVQSTRVVNRVGVPTDQKTIGANLVALANGTPAEKMRAANLLWWFFVTLMRQENDQQKAIAFQIQNALEKAANDPDPQVRAHVSFSIAQIMPAEMRRKQIDRMLGDSAWESRLLALLLTQMLPADQWPIIAAPIAEGDPDEIVMRFATAVVDFADNPAATQPATTQPSGETEASEPVASP